MTKLISGRSDAGERTRLSVKFSSSKSLYLKKKFFSIYILSALHNRGASNIFITEGKPIGRHVMDDKERYVRVGARRASGAKWAGGAKLSFPTFFGSDCEINWAGDLDASMAQFWASQNY